MVNLTALSPSPSIIIGAWQAPEGPLTTATFQSLPAIRASSARLFEGSFSSFHDPYLVIALLSDGS